MLRYLGIGLFAAVILSTACGSSVSTGTGGETTTSSTTTGTGGTGTGGTGGTGGTTGQGGSATGGSTVCGGFAGKPCAADEYCDFPDDICGATDGSGVCKKRPNACIDLDQPTCGCDGMVHGNPCDANSAGFDSNNLGGCKPPVGMFACGAHFCALGLDYCQQDNSDIGGEPSMFSCKPLPPLCEAPPTCSCLANVTCGANCQATPDGGLNVTCLGG